jgi:hypothetical protein
LPEGIIDASAARDFVGPFQFKVLAFELPQALALVDREPRLLGGVPRRSAFLCRPWPSAKSSEAERAFRGHGEGSGRGLSNRGQSSRTAGGVNGNRDLDSAPTLLLRNQARCEPANTEDTRRAIRERSAGNG